MKVGVNQFCWPTSYDVKDAMTLSKNIGFDSFEVCFTAGNSRSGSISGVTDALNISNYCNRLLNVDSNSEDIMELKKLAQDIGIRISSVGGIISFSIYPLTSPEISTAQKSQDAIKKMIEAAQMLEADTVLVIPGMLTEDMRYEEAYDRVQKRISNLADFAPEINLAIENVWNNFLYSPIEMNRFVDEMNKPNVGIYFDVANARTFGYPEQWILTLGQRIKKLHVKDFRMSIDNINGFTNILDGDVNYLKVINSLNRIGYEGDLIVELIPPAQYMVYESLKYARNTVNHLINKKSEV